MKIPAIGGKDSMSGTFMELNVPPTLVAFAVNTVDVTKVLSPEFKKAGSHVVLVKLKKDSLNLPDFTHLDRTYSRIHELAQEGKILSASSVKMGGIAEAVSKMCFGNDIGFKAADVGTPVQWLSLMVGNLVLEIPEDLNPEEIFNGLEYQILGVTTDNPAIVLGDTELLLDDLKNEWEKPLENIFSTRTTVRKERPKQVCFDRFISIRHSEVIAKPRVFIPVFPGTNCEYDTTRAFEKAGALADVYVMKNLTPADIEESVQEMKKKIDQSQIIMIPGGFSAGDEPDGSGKFIATAFRNPFVKDAVMEMLKVRDGLMLGICNGFQALIKLGLVPYGEIRDMEDDSPTLTFNSIGRHVSCMVRTQICSNKSPWLSNVNVGEIHTIAVSHGEGRFVACHFTKNLTV
jgi:phosphoribosylformylglycinamidine synthase